MDRHANAPLSLNELLSLRRIASDPQQPIPGGHLVVLLSMNLLQIDAGQLSISNAGLERLKQDDMPGAQLSSPDL